MCITLSLKAFIRRPHGAYITGKNVDAGGTLFGHRFPPCVLCSGCASFADACLMWPSTRIVECPV